MSRPAEEASIYKANDGQTGLVQALLFDVRDRNRVGYVSSGRGRHFCCSPELVGRTGCTVGKLIVSPTSGDNEVISRLSRFLLKITELNSVLLCPVAQSGGYPLFWEQHCSQSNDCGDSDHKEWNVLFVVRHL